MREDVGRIGVDQRSQVLQGNDRAGGDVRQLKRHRPPVRRTALVVESRLREGLKLGEATSFFVHAQQLRPRNAQLRPQLQRPDEVADRTGRVAVSCPNSGRAVQEQGTGPGTSHGADMLLEQAQLEFVQAQTGRDSLRRVQGREVAGPATEQRLKLLQCVLVAPKSARQETGDLELQTDLAGTVVGVQQLLPHQVDKAFPVAGLPQKAAKRFEARQVVIDRVEGSLEQAACALRVSLGQRELPGAVHQLGASRR